MDIQTSKLNQTAIYWAKSGQNGYGTYTYELPIEIECRWENKTEFVKSSKGEEVLSSAKVFVDREIDFEGFLQLGTVEVSTPDSPENEQLAYSVIRFDDMPNVKGSERLLTVRL